MGSAPPSRAAGTAAPARGHGVDPRHSGSGPTEPQRCGGLQLGIALIPGSAPPMTTPSIYPLTPLQQGMLYHTLAEPNSGVNVEQVICNLPEFIDGDALRGAWERLLARHAVLRTRFRWEGVDVPLQEVPATVNLAWTECDWTSLDAGEQAALFEKFLHVDRLRGFTLEQAPVLRVTLLRLGPESCRLLWTFHHAILDGRCYPALLQEVFADYAAARRGEPFTAETRPEYRTFVEWLNARDPSGSDEFWRDQLHGIAAATPLPVDHEAPAASAAETEPRLGVATARIAPEVVAALREFGDEHGLTLGTLIQGAWALLLSRHSGGSDVVFGATRACRKDGPEGVASILGLVINTVPLRVPVNPNESLLGCLQALRERWLAIRPHEQTPLPRIQRLSEVPAGQALFDSLVVIENYRIGDRLRERDPAWAVRSVELREQTNYALTLAAGINCEMGLRLFYDRRRYREKMADTLLMEMQEFLTAMLRDPRQSLSAVTAQSAAPAGAAGGHRFFAPQETIVSRFEQQVRTTPDRIALTGVNTQFTYAELNARAEALAERLRARGVAPEVRVGLFVDRSPELIIAILAILKAGGAYVPIDPTYPPERISFLLADAGMGVLVTHNGLESRLPPTNARIVRVDDPHPAEPAGAAPRSPAKPASLAYVIYTSGSTGKPKGVEITHHNVVRLFQGADEWFDFGAEDVWTMFHSPAFDFSVWEIWGALLYGGRLVIVPYGVSRSPADFLQLLARERVTVLNQTPSAFRQLQFAEAENPPAGGLALRYVVFGGEALDIRGLRPWFERHGDERPKLVNMYGITETTVHVTVRPLTKADTAGGSVIGVPLPDLQLHVLDAERRPVAVGETGELYVGGAGLARGYLNRPELTAERFIPSPFAPGERLYRTGDLARSLGDGDLEYLGRGDQQVKIRGFRIELGEIESVLAQFTGVRGTVVVARNVAGSADKRLVAYLMADPERRPSTAQLREHCGGLLPEYMVPSAFVLLERLPLTAHGKIDRDALPEPPAERPDLASPYIAPRTEAERTIAAAWCAVLNLERVGLDDNFYELGGDSLSLVTLVGRLRGAGYPAVTITDFFQFPTVGALARQLGKPALADSSSSSVQPWTEPAAPEGAAIASAQS
ncbi:MAG: non-ribosomal peptide synthetase [Opitutus sp.]|nr:non-ribosomal peptide synthetase [Opitutus sp.]